MHPSFVVLIVQPFKYLKQSSWVFIFIGAVSHDLTLHTLFFHPHNYPDISIIQFYSDLYEEHNFNSIQPVPLSLIVHIFDLSLIV